MLKTRSKEKELIDLGPQYYSAEEYSDCLRKLFKVNKVFGFFRSTIRILKSFSENSTLLDIGCGGGLFVLHLSDHFPKMKMIGIDISSSAISQANQALLNWPKIKKLNVSFQVQDRNNTIYNSDIIIITLVCHHLEDDELVIFLQSAYQLANKVVIINELHRNRLALILYKILSPLLFQNRLIIHDGLISIRRSFLRSELKKILQHAGISKYKIKWCFPFRWQVILLK